MPGSSGRTKRKIRWSKLYSFACLRPVTAEHDPSQQLLGQPGFSRVVFCNEPLQHNAKPYKYPKNYVSTTKYNVVTFLPKALFEQFRRVANLYFLLAAVLSITSLAPFTSISLIAPLVFVVGVSMIKEAVEDWHRFLQDLNVNSRTVKAHVGDGKFIDKSWQQLSVGDVVKVNKNEYFPSDLLLLSSSYEDGICYVETMNLDGETNLKVKRCSEATLGLINDQAFGLFRATVRCEDPNPHLYTFVGNLELKNVSFPLCPATLLLRDSKLRNTDYIYGVVIFSGPDSKAVRNSTRSPSKRSQIERKMDLVIYLLFTMLLLISLVTASGFARFLKSEMVKWWYLSLEDDDPFFNPSKPEVSGFLQFIRALILYGYLIPISLYVSIEVVKVLQAMLINKDIELYDEVTRKSVQTRTSNLNEELGQVGMILSDKTGTLTCNQMEFRKCSIAGISYGGDINEIDRAASKRMNVDVESYHFSIDEFETASRSCEMLEFSVGDISTERAVPGGQRHMQNSSAENSRISYVEEEAVIKGFNFRDDRLLNKKWFYRSNLFDVTMFFRVMALCHTGIPVEEDDQTHKLKYEAESPEEVSFLIAAQEFGFQFFQRSQSVMFLREFDPSTGNEVERKYKLLNLLEFCSARKRMSVIVSNEEGQIFLLCKGADNIIFDRLAENGRTYQQATTLHLSNYAEDGFRTLAFAYRKLEVTEYEQWNSIFKVAKTTIGPEREEILEKASEMIEKDLILLGVAAVEDKLQKGAMKEDILNQLESFHKVKSEEGNKDAPLALVVDGKALEIALRSDVKDQFLPLAVNCASVICCRVSPKQKALVGHFLHPIHIESNGYAYSFFSFCQMRVNHTNVAIQITRLVKEHTGRTTLAIGDGANDVGMIQEADIGVGISGMEGMQAVMASDISLPQFRFLGRLLIVHGHWCYKRISKMILYFVYKNIAFGLTLFYYELYTRFAGEVLYDDWYMALFNVILTSLPVISLGVLEQDVSSEVCLQFPALYQQGQKNIYFTWKRILGWILNGVVASLVIFLANIYTLSPKAFQKNGAVADITHLGAMTYTCIIWTVNCQIALIINHFTWIQHLFIWGSILIWYVFLLIYGTLPPAYSQRGFRVLIEALGPAPLYWTVTLFVVVVSLLPYFIHIIIQRSFYPLDDHVIQEMKYFRKDVADNQMWERERSNSIKMTQIGFSARVDARIRFLKEHLHQKKQLIYRSVTSSPIFKSLTSSPA
ncbi:hypothetical protein ACE6H2_013772 [Prunus campanulata]